MSKFIYYIKNICKNIIYGLFPFITIKFKKPTGRRSAEINSFHFSVFNSYFKYLDIKDVHEYLRDKIVVEIGPGNVLGTAFYALVYGAKKVICIDRFPIAPLKEQYNNFLKLVDYVPNNLKENANKILKNYNDIKSSIIYFSDLKGKFEDIDNIKADIILSNAVLEHAYDLPSVFNMITRISKKDTIMFHGIDLQSHGMHYKNELDFLFVNKTIWNLMTCYRSAPNRLRRSDYIKLFEKFNIKILKEITIKKYDETIIKEHVKCLYNNGSLIDVNDLKVAVVGFVCKVC